MFAATLNDAGRPSGPIALNVMRTVEELEAAGIAALMIEDTLLACPDCGECWASDDTVVPEHQARTRRA